MVLDLSERFMCVSGVMCLTAGRVTSTGGSGTAGCADVITKAGGGGLKAKADRGLRSRITLWPSKYTSGGRAASTWPRPSGGRGIRYYRFGLRGDAFPSISRSPHTLSIPLPFPFYHNWWITGCGNAALVQEFHEGVNREHSLKIDKPEDRSCNQTATWPYLPRCR
jgi:hypothetical protein